jgi:hypothetical protein
VTKPLRTAAPPAFTLDELHDALNILLERFMVLYFQRVEEGVEEDEAAARGKPLVIKWTTFDPDKRIPTRSESRDMDLIEDPEWGALRLGIYRIGEICLTCHGNDAMRDLDDRQWDEPDGPSGA